MKKYLYILVALVAAGFTVSCESSLDIPQKRVIDFATFYENASEENAKELIGGVYRLLHDQVYNAEPSVMLDALSDDCWAGGGSFMDNSHGLQHAQAYKLTSSNCDCLDKIYENCYKVIYYSNCIIEKIPSNEGEIARIKAEAKFLRALATFTLVRYFGTPPFVDHIPSSDEYYPSNGDTKTMIDWCITNMKEAAEVVPALSGMGTQAQYGGRITKHGALAFAGKVALWYGTRYDDPSYVAQAVEPLKTVVNSGLYGLIDDMSILYRKQADFCKEYVFEHNAADNDGYLGSYQADNRNAWYTWANMWLPKGRNVEGWGWDHPTAKFGKWFEQHEGGIDKPRFKAFIHTYDQVMELEYNDENKGVKTGQVIAYNEGYFRVLEMHYEDAIYQTSGFWKMSMYNLPYLRYSEVLLMYAEAQFLANKDADGTGLKALNEVRRRAQIPELTSMTYQDIKDERRAELWGQRERFFDLQRWGDAPEALKDKAKTSPAFKGYKPGTTEWDIDYSAPVNGQGWQDKYMLLPFPYKQVSANPNLKQNPGW